MVGLSLSVTEMNTVPLQADSGFLRFASRPKLSRPALSVDRISAQHRST